MSNSIYKEQIEMIHSDMNMGEELKHSKLQAEFNLFKSVLLGLVSAFKYSPEKERWTITELHDVVETMMGSNHEDSEVLNTLLKAVNYLTANKTNILNIHFIYFLENKEDENATLPLTPEQYRKLISDDSFDSSVFSEDEIKEIGGVEMFKQNRLGFYCTIIPQEEKSE